MIRPVKYIFTYDKQKFANALKTSLDQGLPTEDLYTQVLGIGQEVIGRLLQENPLYANYIDDLISDLDERCVELVQHLMTKPKKYPVAYIRRAIWNRFLDVVNNTKSVRETRQTKVRLTKKNKPTLQQTPLKSDTRSHMPEYLKETWEILCKIAKTDFEIKVMRLRAQGYTKIEISKQLGVHRLKVLRTLKALLIRYKDYMENKK